jgi:dCMP deaminase
MEHLESNDVKKSKKLEKYMALANFKAEIFSKDPSAKVCALILAPDSMQELSSGFNGPPRKINDEIPERWERPAKYFWVEHAERNAIYNASRRGTPLEKSIMVVNKFPCADCARAIIQVGVVQLYTVRPDPIGAPQWAESWDASQTMLNEAGIDVIYQ